jgi:putative endonuclease
MSAHNDLGKAGEQLARTFLESAGYRILRSNFREQYKETDIICENAVYIVFAEVKTRSDAIYLEPNEVLTKQKIRHLVEMADTYISENNIEKEFRFDLLLVSPGPPPRVVHIESAFEPQF